MAAPEPRREVVCGVDLGSTNIKVVALARDGEVLARRGQHTPRNEDATVDVTTLVDAVEAMIIDACTPGLVVQAVCVAGVGEDGVLVDESLTPLGSALPWFDSRRQSLFASIVPDLPAATDLCTADDPARTLVGWRWARAQPDTDHATRWLALTDYASSLWAHAPFMSDTLAPRTAAWSRSSRDWIGPRVDATLGSTDLLPPLRRAGDIIGPLDSSGLRTAEVVADSAVVIAGGHDHPVGGWAVHASDPSSVLDSMGTAEVIVAQSPRSDLDRSGDVDLAPGIGDGATTVLRVTELARNFAWATKQDPDVGRKLEALVTGKEQPNQHLTSDLFIPGSNGGGQPSYAPTAVSDSLSKASAILGALARLGEESHQAVTRSLGSQPASYVAGGWSRSPGWVQAKRQVSGRQIAVIPEPQVTATAAALLAAQTIGWNSPFARALGLDAAALST